MEKTIKRDGSMSIMLNLGTTLDNDTMKSIDSGKAATALMNGEQRAAYQKYKKYIDKESERLLNVFLAGLGREATSGFRDKMINWLKLLNTQLLVELDTAFPDERTQTYNNKARR